MSNRFASLRGLKLQLTYGDDFAAVMPLSPHSDRQMQLLEALIGYPLFNELKDHIHRTNNP